MANSVEINIYPLSLPELCAFHDFQIYNAAQSSHYGKNYIIYDKKGLRLRENHLVELYLLYGGIPQLSQISLSDSAAKQTLEGIRASILLHDIIGATSNLTATRKHQTVEYNLLNNTYALLAENVGRNMSDTCATRLLNERFSSSHAVQTVQAYIRSLTDAHLFYPVKRYDIKGEKLLSTLGRRYIVDTGLGNIVYGQGEIRLRQNLENVVYFELLRRGFKVTNGMLRGRKVDFVAERKYERVYIQIVESENYEAEFNMALASLSSIRDSYEKVIITNDLRSTVTKSGVKVIKAVDFLLNDKMW